MTYRFQTLLSNSNLRRYSTLMQKKPPMQNRVYLPEGDSHINHARVPGRSLHSSTSRLNLSCFVIETPPNVSRLMYHATT
jgi:hypothetical protein